MSDTRSKILLLGATGYIGGSVLVSVKDAFPNNKYSVLVRDETSIPKFRELGISPIQGTYEETEKISELVSQSDIVFNCADADNLRLTRAILSGFKKRFSEREKGRSKPILIHTSGTGAAMDDSNGSYGESKPIYNDSNEDDIRSIPPDAFHRNVDLEIFNADEEGYVSAYIIAPATIYGTGIGPCRIISDQVPKLIMYALETGRAGYIGEGSAVWPNVHIKDLTHLYITVLKHALEMNVETVSPYAKFFWGATGTHVWKDVSQKVGTLLHEKGKISQAEPVSIENPGGNLSTTGTNSRVIAGRGISIGWKPDQPSLFDTLPLDVDVVLTNPS